MRLYRKLPVDERRKGEDSEYIFEHHTERKYFRVFPVCFLVRETRGFLVGCDGSCTRYRARVSPEITGLVWPAGRSFGFCVPKKVGCVSSQ